MLGRKLQQLLDAWQACRECRSRPSPVAYMSSKIAWISSNSAAMPVALSGSARPAAAHRHANRGARRTARHRCNRYDRCAPSAAGPRRRAVRARTAPARPATAPRNRADRRRSYRERASPRGAPCAHSCGNSRRPPHAGRTPPPSARHPRDRRRPIILRSQHPQSQRRNRCRFRGQAPARAIGTSRASRARD